jgi:hypothetical protein
MSRRFALQISGPSHAINMIFISTAITEICERLARPLLVGLMAFAMGREPFPNTANRADAFWERRDSIKWPTAV